MEKALLLTRVEKGNREIFSSFPSPRLQLLYRLRWRLAVDGPIQNQTYRPDETSPRLSMFFRIPNHDAIGNMSSNMYLRPTHQVKQTRLSSVRSRFCQLQ